MNIPTAPSNLFEVEAPPPFSKFDASPKTIELKLASGDVRRLLAKDTLKRHLDAQAKLREWFSLRGLDALLSRDAEIRETWRGIRTSRYDALKTIRDEQSTDKARREAKAALAILKSNVDTLRADRRAIHEKLKPYRKYILMERHITARITEHEAALKDEKINAENRALMHLEANTVADAIVTVLNGLDFCFRTTVRRGREVKERIRSVKFQRIVVTPDTIQIKVKAGSRGLFGGFINHLPQSVNIVSAMKNPNVLAQVATMIEMPVACPQLKTEQWHQGTWFLIQRNGLIDGLPKHVRYREYIQRYPNEYRDKLPIPSGLREGSWVGWEHLADNPHLIITGQTGSGKTNAMLSIISTLISKHSPQEIQFVFVDLKEGVDLHMFADIPHAIDFIEADIPRLAKIMVKLEHLRAERMNEIKEAGVRNINEYNRNHPQHRMPHIAVVIDEFGALAARSHRKESAIVYDLAEQLAMKARASGIHLLLGVQTPRKEHIPVNLRDNITLKYAGSTANVHASIAAIGVGDAAELPRHPGRFLCKTGPDMYPVQMPEITDSEVDAAIKTANTYERIQLVDLEVDATPDALPVTVKMPFDRADFIRIVLEDLNGAINYTEVYKIASSNYDVSQSETRKIADEIKSSNTIEHDGCVYEVQTAVGRGARKLVLIE